MIRILLVDDEDYIRQGIRYAIPWEEHDIEIVGEASNGVEAYDLAIKLKPDVVLADIEMPLKNGIELASELNEVLPETKVIILTAFNSPEHLTGAIKVKVSDFILKSADSSQILNTVLKIKNELEKERELREKTAHYKGIYDENRHLIKATLLSRFILGQISYSHFLNKAKELELETGGTQYSLVLLKCNDSNEKHILGQLFHLFYEHQPFAFYIEDGLVLVILDTSCKEVDIDVVMPSISPLIFGNHLVVMASIDSYEDFTLAYHQMMHQLEHCFWEMERPYIVLNPQSIFPQGVSSLKKTQLESPDVYTLESDLLAAIVTKEEKLVKSLMKYYESMKELRIPRFLFLESVKRILILVHTIREEPYDLQEVLLMLQGFETPEEIIELLESLLLAEDEVEPVHLQIVLATSYIKEHYQENLYLDEVAKKVHLSSGYLSRIFKLETGYSFKEYLHLTRIKKAQELLLNTNLKYYEIAEKVGYKDYKYFSSYFSKISGCSAKEYKIKNISDEKNKE